MKTQRKERGGLWKLPQPWKSENVAFGDFLLMISTAAWKACAKNAPAFPQLPQAQRLLTINQDHCHFPCLTDGVQSRELSINGFFCRASREIASILQIFWATPT